MDAAQQLASPVALKDSRHGKILYLKRDMYVGRSFELYGEFSQLETVLFEKLVKPGMLVVEVGANIGAHTVSLAQMVGPGGLVLAFEPQRVIFQLLCANVALNGLFNVRTYQMGVGTAPGTLVVPPLDYAAEHNFGGVSLRQGGAGEAVPVTPLDSFNLPALHVLKIDVEGMEAEVLGGARRLIAQHRPMMYLENDRKEKSAALFRLVDELGYNCWWHMPPLFNPDNFYQNQENIFPGTVSVNILCLPKESPVVVEGFRKVSGPDDLPFAR
jgi:FkbM family methyltransferase